jgi:NAD(P)-dependent dehydrogenase (short-subunit alcohol dehydrogenase family)
MPEQSTELADRVALITGGGRGIGLAAVRRLARDGAHVAVADLDRGSAEAAVAEVDRLGRRAVLIPMDVASAASVDEGVRAVEASLGRIDVLVNSAGILGPFLPVWETPVETWDRLIAVHLRGTFLCCRAVLPGMMARRWGRIVNLASLAGKEGFPLDAAYSAAKAGVIAFTKSLAKEMAEYNVRVNAVAPTVIETDLARRIPAEEMAEKQRRIPMGRFGRPEEVAALIRFLVSDESSFITGQCSDISGGRATY